MPAPAPAAGGDRDKALAAAIKRLLSDATLRCRFGARSRAVFDRGYDSKEMVRRYEALYLGH